MQQIRIIVFYEPDKADLASIQMRAEHAFELKVISALPEINIVKGQIDPFWVIALNITEQDYPFWLGFYLGKDFCVNNRYLTVGCE